MAVNPTLLRAIAGLLQKQSGKDISIPPTGRQGTVVGGEWRPQTHKERKFERVDDPESAGPGVQSKLVDVEEGRLVRDIEHIMPESGRGTVSPEQQVANLTRQLLIGVEQGRISSSSPLLKELLETVENIPVNERTLASQAMRSPTDAEIGIPQAVREQARIGEITEKLTGDPSRRIDPKMFDELFQPQTRSGKLAVSGEGGLTGTMERNLAAGVKPEWGSTIASGNMFEVILRRLTEAGVPPQQIRSIARDILPPGAAEKASAGQKAVEGATRALQGKDFPYEGGSGLAAMQATGRLQGAGSGLTGASEMVLLRSILGGIDDPKLRRALGEAAYLKGGKEAETVAEAVASGRKEALGTGGVATGYGERRAGEALRLGPTDVDAPLPDAGKYAKTGRSSQLDDIEAKSDKTLKGVQYADDPEAVPYYRASDYVDRTPPKKRPTTAERELIDRRSDVAQAPESAPVKTGDIVGPKLQRGDTMDLEGTSLAENQAQHMFDLKNQIDDQLDELIQSTRGMEKRLPRKPNETNAQYNKRLAKTGTFDFRDKIEDTKKALAAAYEKQDFDEVVNISHRLDKGEFSSPIKPTPAARKDPIIKPDERDPVPHPSDFPHTGRPESIDELYSEGGMYHTKQATSDKIQYEPKPSKTLSKESAQESVAVQNIERDLAELRLQWKEAKNPVARKMIESKAAELTSLLERLQ